MGRRSLVAQPSASAAPVSNSGESGALIDAALRGDRRAAERLVAGLVPRVGYLVRYLVRGDHDSDDISQEALVAILRGIASFRATGTLQSWADRVVVRSTFAFIRRRQNEPTAGGASLRDVEQTVAANVEDEYLTVSRAGALLADLPREQRDAMFLHHVLEMSVPEIAEHLAAPTETIRSRLRRGLTRLRSKEFAADESIGPAARALPGAGGSQRLFQT